MSYWSVYVSAEDERVLKGVIKKIADKKRWSFSQAIAAILKEHLIKERNEVSDDSAWEMSTTQSFFEGYSEKDEIYDSL